MPEASGSFRLLRDHRQLASVAAIPDGGDVGLEAVALAATSGRMVFLGLAQPAPATLSATSGDRDPLGVPSRGEFLM